MSDTPRTELLATNFIREISDGWGEDVENKDIARLVEMFSPLEKALKVAEEKLMACQSAVDRIRYDNKKHVAYGINFFALGDAIEFALSTIAKLKEEA